ncbi:MULTISPECIES: hypothetical protein [Streptomyces]|nr:hypothetical protein [Streptomyces sp. NEAU-HV9]
MTTNLARPRAAVYDSTGGHRYFPPVHGECSSSVALGPPTASTGRAPS